MAKLSRRELLVKTALITSGLMLQTPRVSDSNTAFYEFFNYAKKVLEPELDATVLLPVASLGNIVYRESDSGEVLRKEWPVNRTDLRAWAKHNLPRVAKMYGLTPEQIELNVLPLKARYSHSDDRIDIAQIADLSDLGHEVWHVFSDIDYKKIEPGKAEAVHHMDEAFAIALGEHALVGSYYGKSTLSVVDSAKHGLLEKKRQMQDNPVFGSHFLFSPSELRSVSTLLRQNSDIKSTFEQARNYLRELT